MKKSFIKIAFFGTVICLTGFACKKSATSGSGNNSSGQASATSTQGEIVYIDIDTVFARFDMYKDVQAELQGKVKNSEDQYQAKEDAYRKGVSDYQYKIQRGLVTRSEAETIEQGLGAQQQELMQLQNSLQMKLQEESAVAQRKVLNFIMEYLKEAEKENGYKYVLAATFGSNILYANESLNITNNVIEGINARYKTEKEKSK